MDEPPRPPCSTCRRPWSADEFYGSSTECRPCKQKRSRINRLVAARKIALAERLVAALERLADQGQRAVLIRADASTDQAESISAL